MKDNFLNYVITILPALSKAVAWHIDMDTHPSQWKEPLQKRPHPLQEIQPSDLNQFSTRSRDKSLQHASLNSKESLAKKDSGRLWINQSMGRNSNASTIWKKSCHPPGIPKHEWEHVLSRDVLASKNNHWQVDPVMDRVQYILNKPSSVLSEQSSFNGEGQNGRCLRKSSTKLSLQVSGMSFVVFLDLF